MLVYQKTHQQDHVIKFARIDIQGVVLAGQAKVAAQVKQDMTDDEKMKLMSKIKNYTDSVASSLKQMSSDCGCVIINSSAILQLPPETYGKIIDLTPEFKNMVLSKL